MRQVTLPSIVVALISAAQCALAAPVREVTLDNGLRVLLKSVAGLPLVSVWSVVRAGSVNEHPGITGAAHWCEHMNFKGTKKYSREEMKNLLEVVGGEWNGYTWLDQTAYHETLPSGALELALDIEAQRLTSSLFSPGDVEAERSVILSELHMGENDPENLLDITTTAAAIEAHPYRWPTIGWESDIRGMSRRNLYGFYRRYYCPSNATLVVAGDFDEDAALAMIRRKFGAMKPGLENRGVRTVEPPQKGLKRVRLEKGGVTPYLLAAYHAPAWESEDFFPLLVLCSLLGGGQSVNLSSVDWRAQSSRSSRLYRGLVDREFAAKAGALYLPTKYPFLFYVYATAAPGVDLEDLERETLEIVEGVSKGEIPEDEFRKAVTQLRARFVYDTDSVTEQAHILGFFASLGDYRFAEEFLSRLGRVTREDVARVARTYFGEENRTVGWYVPTGEGGGAASPSAPSRGPAGYREGKGPGGRERFRLVLPWGRKKAGRPVGRQGGIPPLQWDRVSVRVPSSVRLNAARKVLDNGLVLIVRENHVSPSVAAYVDIAAGSAYDPPGLHGLANFTARMLDRGNVSMSADLIAEVLDSSGTELRISCGRDRAAIRVRMLREKLPMVMEMLAQMIREPAFPPDEVEKQRGQIAVALDEALHDTMRVAVHGLYGLIYPAGHPYRHRVEGEKASLTAISRRDLADFHRARYGPGSVALVLSGDIRREEAEDLVERFFGEWEARRLADAPTTLIPPLPVESRRKTTEIPDKTQVDIALGFRGVKRSNPDYYALKVMNTILGRFGMGGRLGRAIREEKGMAYYAYSAFVPYRHVGPFLVRAGVAPSKTGGAVEEIRRQLRGIMETYVTEAELAESKQYLIRSLPRQLETNDSVAAALADVQFYGLGLDYFERFPELIGGVTRKDVRRVARKYLHPDKCDVSLAGNIK